ncbi:hypothetical protein E2986_10361 [Frieseomelitta varia]|uniref:DUF4776 domain-containing protein n=1 Tax=Frieseomelitta varia TaxID=561572 RepID=A0A833RT05_9HYME|nr:uncharacterized protein LOC122528355 [Frieseomelitta varia]KAF3427658.1 hypothetical protein E2986_10361 [Frieseomelitta varia]
MALQNKIIKFKEEQLYMLEVFVNQVTLNPEVPDNNVKDLLVCVRFVDLPEYEIRVPQKKEAADQGYGSSENSEFRKSCLFAKTPSCLIKAIRWSPVYLDLYRKDVACSNKNGVFLGTAKLSLPACMCKQVIATKNNSDGLSTPCIVKNSFDITDSNGETCANITVILRLSCLGSAIVEQFSLNGKSFMLEDSPLQKFLRPYIFPKSSKFEKDSKDENAPDKDMIMPLLKRPESPPQIPMGHPAFKTLTTAEKLNDPKYREMVYNAYPNEPTCGCLPKNRSTHPMICPSGCTYCMKLRNPDILSKEENKREDTLVNTHCVNNFLPALHTLKQDPPCNKLSRLKGGGDVEQIYVVPTTFRWIDYDVDYAWYDEKHNMATRLIGGGEEKDMFNCSCSGSPVQVLSRKTASRDNDVIPIFDACTPRITSTGATPACICPGKDAKFPRGAAKCMKSPCSGIDCLIRAFKDAQDFVDSIGKVPGLPGLGLMDPSESPYFGRDIDKDYVPPDRSAPKKKAPTLQVAATPTCTAPCSIKLIDDMHPQVAPYSPPITRGIVPPRLGIVREAIPVLPEAGLTTTPVKHRKKEEKKDEKTDKQKELEVTSSALMDSEVGPCGEPRCKSRRRKPQDNSSVTLSATYISSKTRTGVKRAAASPKARHKAKKSFKSELRRHGPQSKHVDVDLSIRDAKSWRSKKVTTKKKREKSLGPGGDRHVPGSAVISQLPIPVSRPVMRYVYFVGDYYPGIHFGHRNCIDIPMRVPANMGWLWNTIDTAAKLKPRIGWRPGAIGRYLYEMLQEAKEISIEELEEEKARIARAERRRTDRITDRVRIDRGRADRGRIDRGRIDRGKIDRGRVIERARSVPSRSKSVSRRQRTGRTISYQAMQKQSKMEGAEEGSEFPPTLHIHRKDGIYYVTMYPIRQETPAEPRLSEPMKPLQFKIVKNKDDASGTSSSTASDMEIEFSPPAAVTRPRKKPDVIHVDTQVRQQEILDAYKTEDFKRKGRRITRRKKDSKI